MDHPTIHIDEITSETSENLRYLRKIDSFPLSRRTQLSLERGGIVFVAQLAMLSEKQFKSLKRLGDVGRAEIRQHILDALNINLGTEIEGRPPKLTEFLQLIQTSWVKAHGVTTLRPQTESAPDPKDVFKAAVRAYERDWFLARGKATTAVEQEEKKRAKHRVSAAERIHGRNSLRAALRR